MPNSENPVKINSLEIENVKRVQAVAFTLSPDGLTLIGGNNGEGKTSILDSIAFALGGNSRKPSNLQRQGAVNPPKIKITLSNGLIVERKGKNSSLTVTDPQGDKSGQALLNSFISELALDLPKFMNSNDKTKAETLLKILGVGEKLADLDHKEAELSNERTLVGRELKSKKGHYEEMPFYKDLPEVPLSANDLLEKNKVILQKNAENKGLRDKVADLEVHGKRLADLIQCKKDEIKQLEEQLTNIREQYKTAQKSTENLEDESTEEIQKQLTDIEDINTKIRCNLEKQSAKEDADKKQAEYNDLDKKIEDIRKDRMNLLNGAELPLPELNIEAGKLTYKGQNWDCMSGAEQLIVSTAIIRKLKPDCGFVLTDKLEQMDSHTIQEFNNWLIKEGLQNIGTTVGDRKECSIIIEDGLISEDRTITKNSQPQTPNKWNFK
jgi:predicted ATP-binding protein involved in virulence